MKFILIIWVFYQSPGTGAVTLPQMVVVDNLDSMARCEAIRADQLKKIEPVGIKYVTADCYQRGYRAN